VRSVLRRRDFNLQALSLCASGLSPAVLRAAERKTMLIVGDSLSAEYGIARGSGWVALLAAQLAKDKPQWQVVNASISGDTTAGGLARLPALLQKHQPALVVIELGGNDALRGFSLKMTEGNLTGMISASQKIKASVLLIGMQVPPNYGTAYAQDFSRMFQTISQKQKTLLVPFLLKGIADATDPTVLFQADRIHPKAEAHPQILANVWPVLNKML
jgi:acyl-CoA thioesterase-1